MIGLTAVANGASCASGDRCSSVKSERRSGRWLSLRPAVPLCPVRAVAARLPGSETTTHLGQEVIGIARDDLTHLDIALDAREVNPDIKAVRRPCEGLLADTVQRSFGIHTALSTLAPATRVSATAAARAHTDHSFLIDDVMMNVARATAEKPSALERRTIARVEQELDLTIILHRCQSRPDLHPAPGVALTAEDRLEVVASLDGLARLRRTNGQQGNPP